MKRFDSSCSLTLPVAKGGDRQRAFTMVDDYLDAMLSETVNDYPPG